jgi:hypothetical protein
MSRGPQNTPRHQPSQGSAGDGHPSGRTNHGVISSRAFQNSSATALTWTASSPHLELDLDTTPGSSAVLNLLKWN